MSNITLNIVEPSSPTPINPVDPGTGTAVPDTGLFTHGIGGAEAAIIATVSLVVILAIIGAVIYHKKKAKQGSTTSLLTKCKKAVKNKKYAPGLAVLALLVSIGIVAGLLRLGVNAIDSEEVDSTETQDNTTALTVTAESEELTIELADEPVFAVLPVEVTVAEATEAGYTLTAYAEDTNLVSTTDSSKVIPMVTVEGDELVALTDNTYGLALLEPDSETDEVYTALSTDSSSPTIIKSMSEYTPTEAEDKTTIYYGFYITPDVPYGTYTGSDIYYDATINTTLVTFDGNDLYFNNDTEQTTNEVEYIAVAQEESEGTINQIISGEYLKPSQALPYIFLGWSEESTATTPTYTSAEDLSQNLPILPNTPITLYAIWQKATTITYDKNGGTGEMDTQTIIAGESANLFSNTFVRDGYTFTGWNTRADGEGQGYLEGAEYIAQADYAGYVTLYAQWEELCPANSICYKPNGANSTPTMADQSASSNERTILWASNYKYDTNNDRHNDYGFAGWSEDKDAATKLVDNDPTNNPVVYGPSQTITTGDLSLEGMKLYAVWIAPEENTTFQTFTCPNNTDMSIGSLIALKDSRDNEVYTVAKLADGNCWMTENLRLDNNATINDTNTNSPISSFTALSSSSSSWCTEFTDACYNQSLLNTNNIASAVSEMTETNANISSYGNYYNWYSATAGNGTYETGSNVTVAGDICPAGWILPIGSQQPYTNGSFSHLDTSMGGTGSYQSSTEASNRWRSFPNNFVYSGDWYGSSANDRGGSGYYWSSTAYDTVSAYYLYFDSDGVAPGTGDYSKGSGISVRCVAPAE